MNCPTCDFIGPDLGVPGALRDLHRALHDAWRPYEQAAEFLLSVMTPQPTKEDFAIPPIPLAPISPIPLLTRAKEQA